MCMQCAATAGAVVGTASGLRAWLGARVASPAGRRRLRFATIVIGVSAVLLSSAALGGA